MSASGGPTEADPTRRIAGAEEGAPASTTLGLGCQATIDDFLPEPDGWVSSVLDEIIEQLAREGRDFTADDVRQPRFWGERDDENVRHGDVGAAFRRAARHGVIELAGYRNSTRPERRHGLLRVWRGAA